MAGIARTGLGFTESLYEQERFEEVLRVAADIRVAVDGGAEGVEDAEGIVEEWLARSGKGVPGYVTPKVAVGAAVGNEKGEILLVQRADSGVWLYPTGWADVGYSAAEVVVKEVEEETGIDVEVVRLIAVLDGLRHRHQPDPALLPGLPVPADRRRAPGPPARVLGRRLVRPRQTCPTRWPGPSGGVSTSSPRFAASTSTSSTTRCARRSGAAILTST